MWIRDHFSTFFNITEQCQIMFDMLPVDHLKGRSNSRQEWTNVLTANFADI